ncbi:hypothetical protein ACP3P6_08795 [Enterobacter mori]
MRYWLSHLFFSFLAIIVMAVLYLERHW